MTLREKQIVELVAQARLNKEIAFELHLAEGTIKEYLNRIFRKLDVKNRTELAVWSFRGRQSFAQPTETVGAVATIPPATVSLAGKNVNIWKPAI